MNKLTTAKQKKQEIRETVRKANEFTCLEVGHKGPLSPWPAFNPKDSDQSSFIMIKSEKERLFEELCCFHTKLSIKESPLGIGVSIQRLPRTGEIKAVEPSLDLLSLKAFMKEHVRESIDNIAFTHWIPLYFGNIKENNEHKKQVIFLAKHALSMICTGTTKRFSETQVLEVMPKLILALILNIMQQKEHSSLKAIRMLTNLHRLFLVLLEEFPNLNKIIDEKLEKFIKDEHYRIKDSLPSLGDMLSMITVSTKFMWKDIVTAYLGEQMDRQVFWILKDVPELEKDDPNIDEERIDVTYKSGEVGFAITMFYSFFIGKILKQDANCLSNILKYEDESYGRMPSTSETMLQKECEEIRKVKSFQEYFKRLGIPLPKKEDLMGKLKESIVNSKRKKYHGSEEMLNALPSNSEMLITINKNLPKLISFYNDKNELTCQPNDPKWKESVLLKFSWINLMITKYPTAIEIASISNSRKINKKNKESYQIHLEEIMNEGKTEKIINEFGEKFGWMELFMKLEFETLIDYFACNPDFKQFYHYLDLVAPYLQEVCIQLIPKKNIKSGYFWLTRILTRMTKLKSLTLYSKVGVASPNDITKALTKGFENFSKGSGALHRLNLSNVTGFDSKILGLSKYMSELRTLKLNNCSYVTIHMGKFINKILADFKYLSELDLSNASIDNSCAKELADGLMRAKQLEKLILAGNRNTAETMNTIIYNLAFSPKITYLDISDITMGKKNNEVVEVLTKLLVLSGSIETIIINECKINGSLNDEFFKALGANKTLKHLYINGSAITHGEWLGKAIAMNAKKNGSLETLNAKECFNAPNVWTQFLENLWISEKDHEDLYGDQNEARKMFGEQLVKKLYCNLKSLKVNQGNLASHYQINNLKKYEKHEDFPKFVKLLQSAKLSNLCLSKCQLDSKDGDLIGLSFKNAYNLTTLKIIDLSSNCIYKEGAKAIASALSDDKVQVEVLNLSKNKIGVSGVQALSKMLILNKKLKVLNLFSNIVDVDGARALFEALKVNTTLEELDVARNRLRNKGSLAIAQGIMANKNSALKTLSIRFNFISDYGLVDFFNIIVFGGSKLQTLFIKYNGLSEVIYNDLYKKFMEKNINMSIDLFDRMKFLEQSILERSIWISPLIPNPSIEDSVRSFFENHPDKVGIVTDVRIREGPKIEGKVKSNCFAFVEFAHPNSVARALRIASKKKAEINRMKFRIYKAGSRIQVLSKQKKKAAAK